MNKWIIRIIIAGIVLSLYIILAVIKPGVGMYLLEMNPERKILLGWLNKRDPELFKRCKVFFDENTLLQDVPMKQEGEHSIITAILCGNDTKFWISNKTRQVECYVSYSADKIGEKLCEQ